MIIKTEVINFVNVLVKLITKNLKIIEEIEIKQDY